MKLTIEDMQAYRDTEPTTGESGSRATEAPAPSPWPSIAPEAFHGLAGRIVRTIAPYSEADPVALLLHVLVGVGCLVGRGVHASVEATRHFCNENVALVGRTSKGRKGQAWSTPRAILAAVAPEWCCERIKTGLSSGEGLIFNVRDPRIEMQSIKEGGRVVDYEPVTVDHGEPDKRLLVMEPEFAVVLKRMQKEGNSVSAIIREAWDSGRLATLTKHSPMKATDAHIAIIAHITQEELLATLTATDRANGFANRILFALVRRSQALPDGAAVPAEQLPPLIADLRTVQGWASEPRLLVRNPEARMLWASVYPKLSEGEPGLIGAVLGRAEAHVLRLSMIYATLDCSAVVTPAHLAAALAVWDYCEASARQIFGNLTGNPIADRIETAIRSRGAMTRTEVSNLFSRHRAEGEIEAALRLLEGGGRIRRVTRVTGGRPTEVWEAAP
jgi:hypothetical protein